MVGDLSGGRPGRTGAPLPREAGGGDGRGEVRVFPPERFAAGSAARIARELRGAVERLDRRRGESYRRPLDIQLETGDPRSQGPPRVSLALAGGSTPRPAYARLAAGEEVPWSRVEVYFGDERAVRPDDPDSNYRMARETLLDRISLPEDRVHRMEAEREDREAAAEAYARLLPRRLDLLLLGIGEDGHTASLFPGSAAAREEERRVLWSGSPKHPHPRMTVTPPVIRSARLVIVLARGAGKAGAVARALEGPLVPASCPAQLARGGVWLLDEEAAAGLAR